MEITEILFNPEGSDAGKEWVELYNAGDAAIDMSHWRLAVASPHALSPPPKNGGTGSLSLAPHAYAILADNAAAFAGEWPDVATVIDTSVSLPNTKGTVSLINGEQVIDAVSYTNDNKKAAGLSLQKIGTQWRLAPPTPGAQNHAAAPAAVSSPPQEVHIAAPASAPPAKSAGSRPSAKRSTGGGSAKKSSSPASRAPTASWQSPALAAYASEDALPDDSDSLESADADGSAVEGASARARDSTPPSVAYLWPSCALGFGALCVGGYLWYRRVKKAEWDIIDETPDEGYS